MIPVWLRAFQLILREYKAGEFLLYIIAIWLGIWLLYTYINQRREFQKKKLPTWNLKTIIYLLALLGLVVITGAVVSYPKLFFMTWSITFVSIYLIRFLTRKEKQQSEITIVTVSSLLALLILFVINVPFL